MKNTIKILLIGLALAVSVGALWFTNLSVTPKIATWDDVQKEAQKGRYRLIQVEALWDKFQKDPGALLLVDTRQDWEFRTGHIKGALNFPVEPTWWSRWRKQKDLHAFLGPNKNRFVVFY